MSKNHPDKTSMCAATSGTTNTAARSKRANGVHQENAARPAAPSIEVQVAAPDMAAPIPSEFFNKEVQRLAALPRHQYDAERDAAAKALRVRLSTLDDIVFTTRKSSERRDHFTTVEPWSEPVDGVELLNEIALTVRRFIVIDNEAQAAVALWIVSAWLGDVLSVAPVLLITAPEKNSGKTQLLTLVGKLVPRAVQCASLSPAVMYRLIEKYHPTLLVDEADALLLPGKEELRAIFDAGHTHESSYVWRCEEVNGKQEPVQFRVFGSKAVAGIGIERRWETLTSRSVVVRLRRKTREESAERLRHAQPGLFTELSAKIARWALDHAEIINHSRPQIPAALDNRLGDNWEPLLAIADTAGGHWPAYARDVAARLCEETSDESAGGQLLESIREIFDIWPNEQIPTRDLLDKLTKDEESPWATWNHGRPMGARQLANLLKTYGIASVSVRYRKWTPRRGIVNVTSKTPLRGTSSHDTNLA